MTFIENKLYLLREQLKVLPYPVNVAVFYDKELAELFIEKYPDRKFYITEYNVITKEKQFKNIFLQKEI